MPQARLVVPGEPGVKKRPRFGPRGTYTPSVTTALEEDIALLWSSRRRGRVPTGQPFALKIVARFAHGKTHRNTKGEVKERYRDALPGPLKDWDNIGKLVSDALNNVAYDDDRFCTGAMVLKEWAPDHQHEGELDIEITWA